MLGSAAAADDSSAMAFGGSSLANADTAAVRDLGTALGAVAFKERTFLE